MSQTLEKQNEESFTDEAWSVFYSIVDDPRFKTCDAHLIFEALSSELKFVPFGQYLKRYIYKKAALQGEFSQIEDKVCAQIIVESFRENLTPFSFGGTEQKPATLASNWLSQQSVRREVVFLLGFGLNMSKEDVSDFLTKALRQRSFNMNDPFETICMYCYEHGFGYPKYRMLSEQFETVRPSGRKAKAAERGFSNDRELLAYLSGLKRRARAGEADSPAGKAFASEYRSVCRLLKKENETGEATPSDVENTLYAFIPRDKHGNLFAAGLSGLDRQFACKRLTRQRIGALLSGKARAERSDLITLSFYLCAVKQKKTNPRRRFADFCEQMNKRLEKCGMYPLYVTDPYECFIMMCLLSENPLAAFSQVWSRSYGEV